VHVFQLFFFLEAAKKALSACREFLHGLAEDASAAQHRRTVSGVHISTAEKDSNFVNNNVASEYQDEEDIGGAVAPEEMSAEVEARIEREMVGEGSRMMIVRGDGTIVDDDAASVGAELSTDSINSSGSTEMAESRSRSDSAATLERRRQDPHLRDGTSVDHGAKALDEDMDYEEPGSPISFKPRRRSPTAAGVTPPATDRFPRVPPAASINQHPTGGTRPKTPIPIPRRTSGYFSPNSTTGMSPPANNMGRARSGSASSQQYGIPSRAKTLMRNNSIGNAGTISTSPPNNTSLSAQHLTRRRTQMHLSLTTSSPHNPTSSSSFATFNPAMLSSRTSMNTPHGPLLSPSIPSIRKRERATSHPDIFQLCQSWAELGPANDLVVIEATPHPNDT